MWILLIIAAILISIALWQFNKVSSKIDDKTRKNLAIGSILLIVSLSVYFSFLILKFNKEAYINALKGNNPYRIEVRTEYRDGQFYNSDTLYVKK